jgi:phosphatidylglycerophosphate synthase
MILVLITRDYPLPSISIAKSYRFALVNCISGVRLAGGPVFVFLFVDRNKSFAVASILLLILLIVSDLVDGALARRWDVASTFGYVLDGVADRSTYIALIVALSALGKLSPLLAFALLFRDVGLYAARSLFSNWWEANRRFRTRVRITAAAFYALIGGIAVVACVEKLGWLEQSDRSVTAIIFEFTISTWIFVAWSYALVVHQIWAYSRIPARTQS